MLYWYTFFFVAFETCFPFFALNFVLSLNSPTSSSFFSSFTSTSSSLGKLGGFP
jgi:hypothetical protein